MLRLVMASENDRVFYGFRSNRNIVVTKFLHISEQMSCTRPFVFYDSDFDYIKSNLLLPDNHSLA